MNILGFEIKSKEEREQEEREYLHRIFPGGTAQKAAVEQQLKERLPREDKKAVMLYYILVKDAMTAGNGMSFEEAVGRCLKAADFLLTPVMLGKSERVMEDKSVMVVLCFRENKKPRRLTPARFQKQTPEKIRIPDTKNP